ncbi:hypothetical protein J3E07_001588 [Methanococcus voltae]|uniref:Uncharacterized protein n=1 Tax=Methanococcus voltae TaxID=2188 RepID=A0A8J7RHV6_METVO|nr:hypothetical protein [Methanococcus voltae]MBP2202147.1 hypothetical protein [Methanococcus voltae]
MTKNKALWLRIDGNSVKDHKITMEEFSKLTGDFQKLVEKLRGFKENPAEFTLYIEDIKPGSAILKCSTAINDSTKLYGVVNNYVSDINNAETGEDIEKHLIDNNLKLRIPDIIKYTSRVWSNDKNDISICCSEELPKSNSEYTYFNKSKMNIIEELDSKYHKPQHVDKYGILTAVDLDLKKFTLKTVSRKIKGSYLGLSENLQESILSFANRSVKIHGKYDNVKHEFIVINSISPYKGIQMDIFGNAVLDEGLKKAVRNLETCFDELINYESNKQKLTKFITHDPVDELKKAISRLENTLNFRKYEDEREVILWNYFTTLNLYLRNYNVKKSKPIIQEMKSLFYEYIYDILLPIPDQESLEFNSVAYLSILEDYDDNLSKKLNELDEKYAELRPSYEELKNESLSIELDEDIQSEFRKEFGGNDL